MKAIIEELQKYELIKPCVPFKPLGPISNIEVQREMARGLPGSSIPGAFQIRIGVNLRDIIEGHYRGRARHLRRRHECCGAP